MVVSHSLTIDVTYRYLTDNWQQHTLAEAAQTVQPRTRVEEDPALLSLSLRGKLQSLDRCREGGLSPARGDNRVLDGTGARLQPLTRSMDCWYVLLSALTARRQKWFVAKLHFFPNLGSDAQRPSQRADYIFYRHTFSRWPFRSDAVSRGLGAETITGDPTPSPANGAT